MKFPWFKRNGIIFIPITIYGWIVFYIAVVYSVYIFFKIDGQSHSVSDTLRNFIFYLFIIGLVYSLLAFFASKTRSSKNANPKAKK